MERGDGCFGTGVDASGIRSCDIALDGITDGDDGELGTWC